MKKTTMNSALPYVASFVIALGLVYVVSPLDVISTLYVYELDGMKQLYIPIYVLAGTVFALSVIQLALSGIEAMLDAKGFEGLAPEPNYHSYMGAQVMAFSLVMLAPMLLGG